MQSYATARAEYVWRAGMNDSPAPDPSDLARTKAGWYDLAKLHAALLAQHPEAEAYGLVGQIFKSFMSRLGGWPIPVETADALHAATRRIENAPNIRNAVNRMASSDFLGAFHSLFLGILGREPLPDCLNDLIPAGRDAHHPLWHAVNPHFHVWQRAALSAISPQDRWQNTPIVANVKTPTEDAYRKWCETPNKERDALLEFIDTENPQSIIDIGCADGGMLRLVMETCPEVVTFRGIDLHHSRINAASEMLQRADKSKRNGTAAIVEVHDLLSADAIPYADMAMMFQVSGVFDDQQLRHVAGKIGQAGIPLIFEATVIDRIDMYHGRSAAELEAAFGPAGYRMESHRMLGDRMPVETPSALICAAKYWLCHQVSMWRRP